MSIIAFRVDHRLQQDLETAARVQKRTKTEIIREALDQYLERVDVGKTKRRAETSASPIEESIGMWDGPEDSSVDTGRRLGEILIDRK